MSMDGQVDARDTLHGLTVLVLGLGASGLAMARWCARRGADVRVWDSRDDPPQAALLQAELPHVRRLTGALDAAALADVRLVLKSPGLAPRDARILPALVAAAEHGVPVQGELGLFAGALTALHARRGYTPRVLAVTGTNGKTTTTAMVASMLERAGKRVAVAGNIGPTLLQTLDTALDAVEADPDANPLPEVWVLELSSFQLDAAEGFAPDAAAVLNLTEDHLDWHGSMDAYAQAKARIFGARTVRVLNRDDASHRALLPAVQAARSGKATRKAALAFVPPVVVFGLDAPRHAGDFGIETDQGVAWLVRAEAADDLPRKQRPAVSEPAAPRLQRLMPADDLRVRGRHNAANALAALALATAIGCPLAPLLHALRDYAGEPHRLQYVATVDGVDAYDDSKGTNVGATAAAIAGLGADKAPARLVVLLGGDGKGQDFAPLADPLVRHARAVATLGRDAAGIEAAVGSALHAAGIALVRHATLEAATRWSFAQARSGDAVLLSPACASLDMFRNYAHRADVFIAAVEAWAVERNGVAA